MDYADVHANFLSNVHSIMAHPKRLQCATFAGSGHALGSEDSEMSKRVLHVGSLYHLVGIMDVHSLN